MLVKVEFTRYQADYILAMLKPHIVTTAVGTDEGQALRRLYNCIKYELCEEKRRYDHAKD